MTAWRVTGETASRSETGNGAQLDRFRAAAGEDDRHRETVRYFRDAFPLLLDGALFSRPDPGRLVRQARESMMREAAGPAAFLRDTLASVRAEARPFTKTGAVAIGPRSARVWWDTKLLRLSPASGADILAASRPVLRFYDFTGLDPALNRWNGFFDIDIDLARNGKTIEFWTAGRSYQVELGILRADGGFESLARSNPFTLPREGRGAEVPPLSVATPLSRIRTEGRPPICSPDTEALDWLAARPDCPERDFQAELIVHLLYRDYLREGQRILRAAPDLPRRDPRLLADEYRRRIRFRTWLPAAAVPVAPPLLVLRLDSRPVPSRPRLAFPLLPVSDPALAWPNGDCPPIPLAAAIAEILHFAALKVSYPIPSPNAFLAVARQAKPAGAAAGLVSFLEKTETGSDPGIIAAGPVFAAAARLRRNLAALGAMAPIRQEENGSPVRCGGREGGRFAKAGVRFTGLSLVLEGRTRPGAQLTIGGRRIAIGADGRFRVECALSGRKAGVPIDVGAPSGDEACGRIVLEWRKRPAGKAKATAK